MLLLVPDMWSPRKRSKRSAGRVGGLFNGGKPDRRLPCLDEDTHNKRSVDTVQEYRCESDPQYSAECWHRLSLWTRSWLREISSEGGDVFNHRVKYVSSGLLQLVCVRLGVSLNAERPQRPPRQMPSYRRARFERSR